MRPRRQRSDMTKRDDVIVPGPDDGGTTPPADSAARRSDDPPAPSRTARGGKRQAPADSASPVSAQPSDDEPTSAETPTTAARSGVFAAGAPEWAALADPNAGAPGGTYSTGIS